MNIAIIGPLCSGKSTFAFDLQKKIADSIVHEEAHRSLAQIGEILPVGEKTTKESAITLFEYSEKKVIGLNSQKVNIVLGSPFDEFMYAVNAMNLTEGKVINEAFLMTLKDRTKNAMASFDIILKIEDFQNIPFQTDGVRPDKDKDYRDVVNTIINDLISKNNTWALLSDAAIDKIKIISGDRTTRVEQALAYLCDLGVKQIKLAEIMIPNNSIFSATGKKEGQSTGQESKIVP